MSVQWAQMKAAHAEERCRLLAIQLYNKIKQVRFEVVLFTHRATRITKDVH